jgi:pyruvate,water dikinase
MAMEGAKDGLDGTLYMIQARPEPVASQQTGPVLDEYTLPGTGPAVVTGRAVDTHIATGPAYAISRVAQLSTVKAGEVLIADTTPPDWGTVMKKAAAMVTNRGGRTCHAAIVARELGVPAGVGAAGAPERVQDGRAVTMSCAAGEVGKVYAGVLPFTVQHIDLRQRQRPVTKILINMGNPELALQTSFIPNDGGGVSTHGVHHQGRHQGPFHGAAPPGAGARSHRAGSVGRTDQAVRHSCRRLHRNTL